MLVPNDRVELVACSDGLGSSALDEVRRLRESLEAMGLRVTAGLAHGRDYGETLVPPTAHPAPDDVRANHLMNSLEDPEIAAVFDVSGGQLATGVMTHLDSSRLARTTGFFMGFSNLTTIANAILASGKASSIVFNPRLLGTNACVRTDFIHACLTPMDIASLPSPARPGSAFVTPIVEFVRGTEMSGDLVGGNLSGMLTLAGTAWFPPVDGTILALEALSLSYSSVAAGLHQLRQMGVFERVSGVLLGQFTAVDQEFGIDAIPRLALEVVPGIPIASTRHFGHSHNSRALMLGEQVSLCHIDSVD